MKKIKIVFTIFIMVVFVMSCQDSFLDVDPTGSIRSAQLTSQKGLEGSLIGAYSMLPGKGGFYQGSSNWLWGGILGGDANKGSNAGDQAQVNEIQTYNALPTNESVLDKYRNTYEGIARVNALLRLLPEAEATVTQETKTRIEAEAKFLRGHYYFELKKNFNNTPYIDETIDYLQGIDEVPNNVDLWPKIEADFQFAYTNLPEGQSDAGRANKWAAGAYLGKTYLFQGKFSEAKAVFTEVIDNGQTANGQKYGLLENYGDLFRMDSDNSKESVFAMQAQAGTGSGNNANPDFILNFPYNGGPAGCCGFNQPSFDLANSFRTVGGLPVVDGTHNLPAYELKTDQGVAATAAFTPDAGPLDPRIDHSIGRRGIPYLDHGPHPGIAWIRDQNYAGPYAPKKFIWTKEEEAAGGVDKSSWNPSLISTNVMLIRFADVLLMAAEAEVELNNLDVARGYVNQVRERAANPSGFVMNGGSPAANYQVGTYDAPWTDQAVARNAVRFERKIELSGEGHRFYDLVRWGIATTAINAYLNYERSKVGVSPFVGASFTERSQYLPIPQREIDILGADVLKQNDGY